MTGAERERIKAETLAWAQELRPGLKELPVGIPGIGSACPLAHALGGVVGNVRYRLDMFSRFEPLPAVARRFVREFDEGGFPELTATFMRQKPVATFTDKPERESVPSHPTPTPVPDDPSEDPYEPDVPERDDPAAPPPEQDPDLVPA